MTANTIKDFEDEIIGNQARLFRAMSALMPGQFSWRGTGGPLRPSAGRSNTAFYRLVVVNEGEQLWELQHRPALQGCSSKTLGEATTALLPR